MNRCEFSGIIFSVLITVTGAVCNGQHRIGELKHLIMLALVLSFIVGLFNPLSYQTRAVRLALTDGEADQVCFEPHQLSSTTPWMGSELTACKTDHNDQVLLNCV